MKSRLYSLCMGAGLIISFLANTNIQAADTGHDPISNSSFIAGMAAGHLVENRAGHLSLPTPPSQMYVPSRPNSLKEHQKKVSPIKNSAPRVGHVTYTSPLNTSVSRGN